LFCQVVGEHFEANWYVRFQQTEYIFETPKVIGMAVSHKQMRELDLLLRNKLTKVLQKCFVLIPVSSLNKYSLFAPTQDKAICTTESKSTWVVAGNVNNIVSEALPLHY